MTPDLVILCAAGMLVSAYLMVGQKSLFTTIRLYAAQSLLLAAVAVMMAVSMLSPRGVRRIALAGLAGGMVLLIATNLWGVEIKGARRWIDLHGISIQASEFVKPCFAVVAAWLFSAQKLRTGVPGNGIAILLYLMIVALLVTQPDVGMTFVVSVVWFCQFFLAGLNIFWVFALGTVGLGALTAGYFLLPHFASRIDRFLDPSTGDNYQVSTALDAFMNGGLMGRGPGEGTVKASLPDAHADFVFAVAGEEFGFVACLLLVGLFAFIVLRGFGRLMQEKNPFVLIAASGLIVQFGLQAVINMASSLNLMPPKGMTLPFVSYGGSSLIAIALNLGMLMALTRRRVGAEAS